MANADPVGREAQGNEEQDSRGVEHPNMAPRGFGGDGENSTKGGWDTVFLFGALQLPPVFPRQTIEECLLGSRLGKSRTGIDPIGLLCADGRDGVANDRFVFAKGFAAVGANCKVLLQPVLLVLA